MKEILTSKQRVEACLKNLDTDRAAVINPTSVATSESCRSLGISFEQVHRDPDKMAALAAVGHEKLGFDSVMPYYSVVQEAAAFGCEIDWGGPESMPNQKAPVFDQPDDFKMPGDFLEKMPIATVIDALKLLKKKFGDSVYIMGKVMGPWTLSYHLHGLERFLMETITDPDIAGGFINVLKDITLRFAEAQFEAGADAVTVADHITRDLAGSAAYSQFLLPVHKEITGYFSGKTLLLHCCGNTLDRIGLFSQAGFCAFHFDSRNDIQKAMFEAGDMKLTGCVNNPDVLLNGTPDMVDAQVTDIIRQGVRLVSPECAVPLQTRNENLSEIVKSVKRHSVPGR